MAISNPAADIVSYLSGQTLGGVLLTSGSNLWIGEMPHEDDAPAAPSVSVQNTGGIAPAPFIGGGSSYFRTAVQVLVRGAPDAYQAGETLALAVLSTLHLATVARAAGGNYVSVLARDPFPVAVGTDESDQPVFSLNFEVQFVG